MAGEELEAAMKQEAEEHEYLRVMGRRVGEVLATRVDVEEFAGASDEELERLIAITLLLLLNETRREIVASSQALALAAGTTEPLSDEVVDDVIRGASDDTLETFLGDLKEQRAAVAKTLSTAEDHGAAPAAIASMASFVTSTQAALGLILAAAASQWMGDIRSRINVATAIAPNAGGAAGAGARPGISTELTWVTMHDERVCHEQTGGASFGDVDIPEGALTSCEARHGLTLAVAEWAALGFPRDTRLLCSRYTRPRCRCILAPPYVSIPGVSVNAAEARARGRARAEGEALDIQSVHIATLEEQAVAGEIPLGNVPWLPVRVPRP